MQFGHKCACVRLSIQLTFHVQLGWYFILPETVSCNAGVESRVVRFQIEDTQNGLVIFRWDIDADFVVDREYPLFVFVPFVAQSLQVAWAYGACDGCIGILWIIELLQEADKFRLVADCNIDYSLS